MALTARDIAMFMPAPVDPTSGARAFSQSMQNIEQARAHDLQAQSDASRLAFDQQKHAADAAVAAEQEQYTRRKDAEKLQREAYTTLGNYLEALRDKDLTRQIDYDAANAALSAHGYDVSLEDDQMPVVPDALTLADVRSPLKLRGPMEQEQPSLSLGGDKLKAPDGVSVADPSTRRLVVRRGDTVVANPRLSEMLPARAQEVLDAYKATGAPGMVDINDPARAADSAMRTERDPAKALKAMVDARSDAQPKPVPFAMTAEAGEGREMGVKMQIAKEVRARLNDSARVAKISDTQSRLRQARLSQKNLSGSALQGRLSYRSALTAVESRLTDPDARFYDRAMGIKGLLDEHVARVGEDGPLPESILSQVRQLNDDYIAFATDELRAGYERDVAETASFIDTMLPGADPKFRAGMVDEARRLYHGIDLPPREGDSDAARAAAAGVPPPPPGVSLTVPVVPKDQMPPKTAATTPAKELKRKGFVRGSEF